MRIRMIWKYCRNLGRRHSKGRKIIFYPKLGIELEKKPIQSLKESYNQKYKSKMSKSPLKIDRGYLKLNAK